MGFELVLGTATYHGQVMINEQIRDTQMGETIMFCLDY